jgi:CRISPR/Cas system CSM-associated protein Csm3 (group 7 of RAMP superfamily)
MTTAPSCPIRYVARATIEFETPFIVAGGRDDLFFDDVFVSDANGLPTLPGSSLAGILRHAWSEAGYGNGNDLFGYQIGAEGNGSRLSISFGLIHDSDNRPVEGIIADQKRLDNVVLAEAKLTTARDHVRISHKGTAADKGKFDERSVSAGHRFTFELLLEASRGDENRWSDLLALLRSDTIRIGGKTRRGYGQFTVVAMNGKMYDLSKEEDFNAFRSLPVQLATEPAGNALDNLLIEKAQNGSGGVTATLHLKPEGFWMIGGGNDGEVDMAPLKANRIVWKDGKGTVKPDEVVVPGSAVKGALSHRVAFHYNRLTGKFAGPGIDPEEHTGVNNHAVTELFGYVKDSTGGTDVGRRGRLLISDIFVAQPGVPKILNHVSIDRFTGGARVLEGALFDEKPYYKGDGFTLTVTVTEAAKITESKVRQALAAALDDLAKGQLALGAGAGRGNGYFVADGVEWSLAGEKWLEGGK